MIFTPTPLEGVWLVELDRHADERGWFARCWCAEEFAEHGLDARLVQASLSFNRRRGTLRGMHYQRAPHGEVKLVRCVRGAIFDVALDLRPASATYRRWHGVELSAENGCALYIPEGVAHGFQTLAADSEVLYQMSTGYVPEAAAGVRHDDPAFAIAWPLPVSCLSPRDAAWPDFAPDFAEQSAGLLA